MLRLEPPEILMVGDNLRDDILGSEAVGMQAILIRRREAPLSFQERHPDRASIRSLLPSSRPSASDISTPFAGGAAASDPGAGGAADSLNRPCPDGEGTRRGGRTRGATADSFEEKRPGWPLRCGGAS